MSIVVKFAIPIVLDRRTEEQYSYVPYVLISDCVLDRRTKEQKSYTTYVLVSKKREDRRTEEQKNRYYCNNIGVTCVSFG
jgi:hypothetical protein